jgi:hypothetical protein
MVAINMIVRHVKQQLLEVCVIFVFFKCDVSYPF